jgi:hypothetical protein
MSEDVNKPGSSSEAGNEITDDKHQNAGAGSEIPDGGESGDKKQIPYERCKEVIDKVSGLEKIVNFFRSHIETPEDLIAFAEYKKEMLAKASSDRAKGNISADQLARFKEAMDAANPELKALVEQNKADKEAKLDAQFDDAEDQIRDLCKTAKLPIEGRNFARIAVHVMDEIRSDEKLLKAWHAGNMKCVDRAFKLYTEEYLSEMRGTDDKKGKDLLAEKRRIMRMPALPSGKSGGPSGAPVDKRAPEDRGITKKTHEDAWDVFQSHMNE